MTKWSLYVLTLGFAVYWASNLLLWFPWSYSAVLGMTLMFTATPILWGYVVFLCLRTYPGEPLPGGAARVAAVLLVLSVVMDYIFFGLIRNALEQLYHPTTLYAYGFLVCLPFLVGSMFRGSIGRGKRVVQSSDLLVAGAGGLACCGALALIILFGIET